MSVSNKHILLISYVFPPHYGIGGRRWARHSEYLTKLGYTVHVVCAKNPFDKKSLWSRNIENNPKIIVYQLHTKFPKVLVDFNHTFFQKILYKFWITVLPLLTGSNYHDRTVFWKRTMLNKASKIITGNQIKTVICTGGPFSVLYYATLLKKKFPDIFLLSDWRDPWTWAPNWGYSTLSEKRMKLEKEMEQATVLNSDVVTVPTESMHSVLTQRYPEYSEKIKIVPHFFDKEEIPVVPKSTDNKIRLVLYGTIYINTSNYFEELAVFLGRNKEKFSLDIYTDNPSCKALFEKKNATNVSFKGVLPAKDLFSRFGNYDFVLLVHPDYGKDNVSTKFYEIIYSRTPIILVSSPGLGSDFVVKNNLGYHAAADNIAELLTHLYSHKTELKYNNLFDVSAFSLEKITANIAGILENGSKSKGT